VIATTTRTDSRRIGTAFDAIAETYDQNFVDSLIGGAQREAVWSVLDRLFRPGQRVLEINCGTGVDAIRLAGRGVSVLACDASSRMIEVARRSALLARPPVAPDCPARGTGVPPVPPRAGACPERSEGMAVPQPAPVEFLTLATEEIWRIQDQAPFDGVLSNFAGLNCVRNRGAVARDLAQLVRPQGVVVLCIFSRFCLWEVCWYLCRFRPRKAFRRLAPGGSRAHLDRNQEVRVYYPGVRALERLFAPDFRLLESRGVGVCVPPSYVEPLARRFPGILGKLAALDQRIGGLPVLRSLGDHTLVVLERS
jgi:SAM-dependent methyltransferase